MQIYIYIIPILIIFYLLLGKLITTINNYNNIKFLKRSTQIPFPILNELYLMCNNYSNDENLIVESSIKITIGSINFNRFAIPLSLTNFLIKNQIDENKLKKLCEQLTTKICGNFDNKLSRCLNKYMMISLLNFSGSTDIIVGYDWKQKLFKIYVDSANNNIECLEFNIANNEINRKIYITVDQIRHSEILRGLNVKDLKLLEIIDFVENNYKLIYKTSDNVYHVVLKSPYKINCVQIQSIDSHFNLDGKLIEWYNQIKNIECRAYVISIKKINNRINNLTIYFRPNCFVNQLIMTKSIIKNIFI